MDKLLLIYCQSFKYRILVDKSIQTSRQKLKQSHLMYDLQRALQNKLLKYVLSLSLIQNKTAFTSV